MLTSESLNNFFFSLGLQEGWKGRVKKVLVGLAVLGVMGMVVYFGAQKAGLLRALTELPEVQKVLKKLDEEIPKEARSLENLIPMAEMAYDAFEKYSKLNQD